MATKPSGGANTTPSIEELYGLEPVYEPGSDPRLVSLADSAEVDCPWCGETYPTQIDAGDSGQTMVEDCQICCRPIELTVTIHRTNGKILLDVKRAE